jgi:hypothetical protein
MNLCRDTPAVKKLYTFEIVFYVVFLLIKLFGKGAVLVKLFLKGYFGEDFKKGSVLLAFLLVKLF